MDRWHVAIARDKYVLPCIALRIHRPSVAGLRASKPFPSGRAM